MNHVLLTGASGFLGSYVRKYLSINGIPFTTIGRNSQNDIVCDLINKVNFENYNFDYVIHCAGKAHFVPNSAVHIQLMYDSNLKSTINLCNALEQLGKLPKQFYFVSTVAVYGKEEGNGITENHELLGTSPYAMSKILTEKFLMDWAGRLNVNLLILRLPLIVGFNPPGNLGKLINGIKRGTYLSIGRGDAKKSMVLAKDVALFLSKLESGNGIYNLTDNYHPCFSEIEQFVSKKLGKSNPASIPIFLINPIAKFGDLFKFVPINSSILKKVTKDLTFDDTLARKEINWKSTPILLGWDFFESNDV